MCQACETKTVYQFINKRKVCKRCFVNWFEKKFFYTIRKFDMIKKGDVVGYENNSVLEELFTMFSKKAPVQVVKLPSSKKITKKAIALTTDDIANAVVESVIKKDASKLKLAPVQGKTICPLYLFTRKEVELYAKLKNLKHKKTKLKKDKISEFLDDLEKKHPEIKWSIVQGNLKLIMGQ